MRDLDVEGTPGAAPRRSAATGVAQKPRRAKQPEQQPEPSNGEPQSRDPAADLTPEDLVLKDDKPAPKRKRARNKRHGRR